MFAGLWNIADKEGRLPDRPKWIKAKIFPYDDIDTEKGLNKLSNGKTHGKFPFIQRYEIENERYIQIINWNKHQKPHHTEKESSIPSPLKNPPLKEKEKGMENTNQLKAGVKLSNRSITVKKFSKPTIEEIKKYCEQRKNEIDAESFFHFYESKNWLIGKTPMKNWQSAIITWEKNQPQTEKRSYEED